MTKKIRAVLLLAATALGALVFAASASANVYCLPTVVNSSCTDSSPNLNAAFNSASTNQGADDIRLAAQTYTLTTPLDDGGAHETHLIGAGPLSVITGTDDTNVAQTYLTLGDDGSSLSNLTVRIPGGVNTSTDVGLFLYGTAAADRVAIDAPAGTTNTTGLRLNGFSTFTDGSVTLPSGSSAGSLAVSSGEGEPCPTRRSRPRRESPTGIPEGHWWFSVRRSTRPSWV